MVNGNNSERFSVGPTSGIMTFAVDYDIDNSVMPSSTIVTVKCVDNTDKTGTAKITLTIQVRSTTCIEVDSISGTQSEGHGVKPG